MVRRRGEDRAGRVRASYAEGMAFGGMSFALTLVIGLVSSIVVARLYGAESLGELALAQAPALGMAYLSTAQEQAGLVRELTRLAPRTPRVTALFAAVLAFSLLLTLAVAAIALPIAGLVLSGPIGRADLVLPAAVMIASYVFVENTSWNVDMLLSAFRAGRQLFWIRLVHALSFLLLAVVAATFVRSIWGLVAATVGGALVALAVRVGVVWTFVTLRVSRAELRDGARALPAMIRWGLKTAPGTLSQGIASQCPVWVMGLVTSPALIGAYSRAALLAGRLVDINHRILEMLFPTLLQRRAEGDDAGVHRAIADSLRYAAIALLWPAAVGGGAAHGVMALFGSGFEPAADALALLLLVPALSAMTSVLGTQLWAVNRPGIVSAIAIGHAAAMVGLVIVLTNALGITGAAMASVIASLVKLLWTAAVARRHWSMPLSSLWPRWELAMLLGGFATGFAVARICDQMLPVAPVPGLIAGSMAYIAVVVLACRSNPRDRGRLRALVGRLPGRLRPLRWGMEGS